MHDALCVLTTFVKDSKTVFGGGQHRPLVRFRRAAPRRAASVRLGSVSLVSARQSDHSLSGAAEMEMAVAVQKLAASTAGKEAVAMDGFARALAQLPTVIADNGGFDSAELVAQLRAAHNLRRTAAGIGTPLLLLLLLLQNLQSAN